jgi:hypothetical protein
MNIFVAEFFREKLPEFEDKLRINYECDIRNSQGAEDYCLLECDAIYCGRSLQMFRREMDPLGLVRICWTLSDST